MPTLESCKQIGQYRKNRSFGQMFAVTKIYAWSFWV